MGQPEKGSWGDILSPSPFSQKLISFLIIDELILTGMLGFLVFGPASSEAQPAEISMDAGNLDFKLDEHATLPIYMSYFGVQQSDSVGGWLDDTYFFFDQSNYYHTGEGDIATGRYQTPGTTGPEFTETSSDIPISLLQDGLIDEAYGSFTKTKDIQGQANDVRIFQRAWNKYEEDWGIIQWTAQNQYDIDLTEVRFGLRFYAAVGGDNADDKVHWNTSESVYYIKDSGSTTYIGFASADPANPLNLYWDGSINDLAYDSDIYNAISNSPYISGFHHDLGCVVGWTDSESENNGMTLPGKESITRALVMVGGNSLTDILNSIESARQFYIPRTLKITEISDEGNPKVEICTISGSPQNLSKIRLSVSGGSAFWHGGSWDPQIIPPNGHSVWTLGGSDSFLSTEGSTLGLYNYTSGILMDEVSFGKMGIAPDPIDDITTGSISKVGETQWLHSLNGSTFGFQNPKDLSVVQNPEVVINEVMFHPAKDEYGFIELMYIGDETLNIMDHVILSDSIYQITESTVLDSNDPYYTIFRNDAPILFERGNLSNNFDNLYLYDPQGNLLDMVGWSTAHLTNRTVTRISEGEGGHNGYNDESSEIEGWVFDSMPSLPLVILAPRGQVKRGDGGDAIWYNLHVKNKLPSPELFEIYNQTEDKWQVELFHEDKIIKLSDSDGDNNMDVMVDGESNVTISVRVTLPEDGISGNMGNTTITAQAHSDPAISHSNILQTRFNPYLLPKKNISPEQIFINGTGYDERATITLEVEGSGFAIPSYKPQDIVFTVDRSDSMLPSEIDLAKQAVVEFIENMSGSDRGAVVHFDSNVVLMNPLTSNHMKLKRDVENIPGPGDLTYMGEALLEALIELNANGADDKVHVIILITDGAWNGNLDPVTVAHWARENNTLIFTIGLGDGAYNIILKQIADITGGENFTAEDIDRFRQVYDKIAHYLDKTAGRDLDIGDSDPMIRDVLPPYIDYIPGSFSMEPDHVHVDDQGYTILEWNISTMFVDEKWSVSFDITSSQLGYLEANNHTNSRVSYINWEDIHIERRFPKTMVTVTIPKPLPPVLSLEIVDDFGNPNGRGNNVRLVWETPPSPKIAYYLIYRSEDQRDFDFSTPWIRTDVNSDCGIIPKRTSWNHTNCAKVGDASYSKEMYYVIKAVNEAGIESCTSRTVGKWTKEFASGISSFSLPIKPIQIRSANWYATDMNADYISWMDQGQVWASTNPQRSGESGDIILGNAYEVKFSTGTRYTFCGLPAAMIRYEDNVFGFDTNEARTLAATVSTTDTVTLTWTQPQNMESEDRFWVLRATEPEGFWGSENIDYIRLADLSIDTLTARDFGVAVGNTHYYYMVVPVNTTSGKWGSSSYGIGVWTEGYESGYDTFAVPLKVAHNSFVDTYCDRIMDCWGINYIEPSEQRWVWHKKDMPRGVYDPRVLRSHGYQISTLAAAKYCFIGY
jgi:hypothetical protein